MPHTNDFKAFATGVGANVIDQATYVALAALAAGFSNGIADPAQLNKVWRQAAFVSSAIAQLMSDSLAADILDDGNLAEFETNLAAMLRGSLGYVADTGAVNAYLAAPVPAPSAYAIGQTFSILAANTNTGAATLNVAGLGAKSIVKPDGTALVGGEILTNSIVRVIYNGASFQLQASNTRNGFSNIQVFTAGGNFNVPAGVTRAKATVVGAGGGGGATGTSGSQAGSGGGAGATSIKICTVTPGQVVAVTVGAGGAGGTNTGTTSGNDGQTGGTSSFGAFCTATGGGGGQGARSTGSAAGGNGGGASGGDANINGGQGMDGTNNANGVGGNGANSAMGGGGHAGLASGGGGGAGQSPGAGGGGTYSGANVAGGAGAAGIVIVEW